MFEINEVTEARLASITNRVEKHGDDEVPAVSLGIEITTGNTFLDSLDVHLKPALYTPKDDEPTLPHVEIAMPLLRCATIDRVTLDRSFEGWTLSIDDTVDTADRMTFGGCKVDKFTVEPKQGGTVVLRFRVGTSDVDAERLGALAMHNGQSIWILLNAPEPQGELIDGTTQAFERDHPPLFDDSPDDDADGEGSDLDAGQPDPEPVPARRTRTKRGRDATEAFLASQAGEPLQ